MDNSPIAMVRQVVSADLTNEQAEALATWYGHLARSVAGFPEAELKGTEPPLYSIPGPKAR